MLERDVRRSPSAAQTWQVLERDRFRCRWCEGPVIHFYEAKAVVARGSGMLTWGPTNASKTSALHLHLAVADHVDCWCAGGRTTLDNLVASCLVCNYGRGNVPFAELGLNDPRLR